MQTLLRLLCRAQVLDDEQVISRVGLSLIRIQGEYPEPVETTLNSAVKSCIFVYVKAKNQEITIT